MYYTFISTWFIVCTGGFIIDYFKLMNKIHIQSEIDIYIRALPKSFWNVVCLTYPLLYLEKAVLTTRDKYILEYPVDMMLYYIIYSTLFYTTHRLFHHPKLYQYSHKVHHTFKYSNVACTFYTHWLDYYITNILPAIIAFYIIPPTLKEAQLTIMIGTINTVIYSHGGYSYFSKFHYYHHRKTTYNYGVGEQIDYLCNTHL